MRPITKKQVDTLLTSVAGSSPAHRDQIMTYAIRYLNLLSGPLTDDDIKDAYSIALDKILIDLVIPENLWNHRCDPLRDSTHELEVPSYREPQTDVNGRPARIIEHEPEPRSGTATMLAEPTPVVPPVATPPLPGPVDNHTEVSRLAHISSFMDHVLKFAR